MPSSSTKFIGRNRPPRVHIEFDVELYGAQERVQLPFVIGVFSDLSGTATEPLPPLAERRMLLIDLDCFDARMKALLPRAKFPVPNTILGHGDLEIDLTFESMDDFLPGRIARKIPCLDRLVDRRTQLSNLLAYLDGKAEAESLIARLLANQEGQQNVSDQLTGPSVPLAQKSELADVSFLELLQKELKPRTQEGLNEISTALQVLVEEVQYNRDAVCEHPIQTIAAIIADIGAKIAMQINLVLHHPDLQRLESAWRGLFFLVSNTETDQSLKIRFMSLSKPELSRVISRYVGQAWDRNPVYGKIHDDEYGTIGGEPYACLIGDYEFAHDPRDIEILRGMAQIAAAAHAPFLAGASPELMDMETWQEISNPRDISKRFLTPEYSRWRSLRESEDARYLALMMPRFLARPPYGKQSSPVEEFDFEESSERGYFVWINAAYAMGANIARAFKLYGWCAHIGGLESGGRVDGLPLAELPTESGGIGLSPTEVSIDDRWEAELVRSGITPLLQIKNSHAAFFIGAQSLHKPGEYGDPDVTAGAVLAARLPFVLTSCRFVHYLKSIARNQIGSFTTREDLEHRLNKWIAQYVERDVANSSQEQKARRPLADAQVVVEEQEGSPGNYLCTLYIRPHYQLGGLAVSLRLITTLPHA